MNKKIIITLSLVTILPIILSIILGSWLPIIIVAVAGVIFFIFGILLWDFTYRKIIAPLTRLFKDKNKRPAVIIISISLLILVITMVIVLIIASSGSNDKKVDETTTLHTSEETTEEKTVTTTEEETTEVETATTTEEITTEEETTTEENISEITTSGKKSEYKEGREENTLPNQEEIASSKKEEMHIPSGAQDQPIDSVETTTTISTSKAEIDSEQNTTTHIAIGPIEKPTSSVVPPTHDIVIPTTEEETTTTSTTTEETTTEEETTTQTTKAEANITVNYTTGASEANVHISFSEVVENVYFKVWWYTEETDFRILNHSELSYTLKVAVPENYSGKLLVGAYEEDGTQLLRVSKIIINK